MIVYILPRLEIIGDSDFIELTGRENTTIGYFSALYVFFYDLVCVPFAPVSKLNLMEPK